jgi:hypothetical protein
MRVPEAMTDEELRALVRGAIERHFGGGPAAAPARAITGLALPSAAAPYAGHASHAQYLTVVNVGDRCVIEPDVDCNHCGYCKSHGH